MVSLDKDDIIYKARNLCLSVCLIELLLGGCKAGGQRKCIVECEAVWMRNKKISLKAYAQTHSSDLQQRIGCHFVCLDKPMIMQAISHLAAVSLRNPTKCSVESETEWMSSS